VAGGAQQAAGGGQQAEATDAAKKEAKKAGLDLSQIQPTGADGRITINDVRSATPS
jgi:pyruvate/2-oxoglutarate dehydrogenase complex dihydrolipoamide acyltransferase (E2) component